MTFCLSALNNYCDVNRGNPLASLQSSAGLHWVLVLNTYVRYTEKP